MGGKNGMQRAMVHLELGTARDLATIESHCGRVIAHYGSSVLVQADERGLKACAAAGYLVNAFDEPHVVEIGGFDVDTDDPSIRITSTSRHAGLGGTERQACIVRIIGPMHSDWRRGLLRLGAALERLGTCHVLATLPTAKLDELLALDFVSTVCTLPAALKLDAVLLTDDVLATLDTPDAITPRSASRGTDGSCRTETPGPKALWARMPADPAATGNLVLALFEGSPQLAAVDAARDVGAEVVLLGDGFLRVFANDQQLAGLSAIPQVRMLHPYSPPRILNNVADGIVDVDVLRTDLGLTGKGQIVAVADTGLDTGVDDAGMHADFKGNIESIQPIVLPGDASDVSGHGTHVAGSIAGNGANSNGKIRGMAPDAKLVIQAVGDADGTITTGAWVGNLYKDAKQAGATIHSNSWGAAVGGAYDTDAKVTDLFAFWNPTVLICFAAGNSGLAGLDSPGTGKNVLTVGACESVRALPDDVSFPASTSFPNGAIIDFKEDADDKQHVADFSSRGVAPLARRKPDVVAPGSWILSTRSSKALADTGPDGLLGNDGLGTGDEDGTATHDEAVCLGLPGQPILGAGEKNTPAKPAGSGGNVVENYMYCSGTSMATPIAAGTCALLRQYVMEVRGHAAVTSQLLRALMVTGAVDMGFGVHDDAQGWGRIDLRNTIAPAGGHAIQFDDTWGNAVATGDVRMYDVYVTAPGAPLVVTLVWNDWQTQNLGPAIHNALHLEVGPVGSLVPGAVADAIDDVRNNVQKVIIPNPVVGRYRILVRGIDVTHGSGGHLVDDPDNGKYLRQTFAVVVAGASGFSCNPSDVVQVIDRSGSMGKSGYMEPAKSRARQMIDLMQINDRAGVVKFNGEADEALALTKIDSEVQKQLAQVKISETVSSGGTNLRAALQQGMQTIGPKDAPDADRPRAMIFLTDGKHTMGEPIDNAFLDQLVDQDIGVFCISLGSATDFPLLQQIADKTGTDKVFSVASAADLHKLHEIYYSIVGSLSCGGLILLESAVVSNAQAGLNHTVALDSTVSLVTFAISWDAEDAEFDFTLQRGSDGAVFGPQSPEVVHYTGLQHRFYRVGNPDPGRWVMRVKNAPDGNGATPMITAAIYVDSEISCIPAVDESYLYQDVVLLSLTARHRQRPLTGGTCGVEITFPTVSVDEIRTRYWRELARIRIGESDDIVDEELVKVDALATAMAEQGIDIFERETVSMGLRDDGTAGDQHADDAVYSGFFNPQAAGVAGHYEVKFFFDVNDPIVGNYGCQRLMPVNVSS